MINSEERVNQWYKNGKFHRDDNHPATIFLDGVKIWWTEGKHVRDEQNK